MADRNAGAAQRLREATAHLDEIVSGLRVAARHGAAPDLAGRRRRGGSRRPRRRGGRRSRTRRADAARVVCRLPVQPAATMRFQRSVHSGRFSAMVAWSRSMRRAISSGVERTLSLQLRRQERLRFRVGARIVELLGVDALHFRIERQVQERFREFEVLAFPWRCRCRRCRGSRPPWDRPTRPAPSSPSRCRSATCRAARSPRPRRAARS